MHNIIDTPSSRVRSVAAGPAELVGQVRPGPQGTMAFHVGGSRSRLVEGAVAWKEEEYVCSKDNDGKESCKWVTRRTGNDSVDSMELEASRRSRKLWKTVDMGGKLHFWGSSNWRWTVWALAAGDPVFCLGIETRTNEEREEGLYNSQLITHS